MDNFHRYLRIQLFIQCACYKVISLSFISIEFRWVQFLLTILQPYWNYRDQPSYLTDERHGARQSVEGGSQSSYETGYTAGGLRSYAAEAYSAGKFIQFEICFYF